MERERAYSKRARRDPDRSFRVRRLLRAERVNAVAANAAETWLRSATAFPFLRC